MTPDAAKPRVRPPAGQTVGSPNPGRPPSGRPYRPLPQLAPQLWREWRTIWRFTAFTTAIATAGCSGAPPRIDIAPDPAPSLASAGVAAAEPVAAGVARTTLTGGGTAADAAAALGLALSVTYPGFASLGAGGACVVYDPAAATVQALHFPAPPAGELAIPALARGLAALHERFGVTAWADVVVQAEGLARRGVAVSAPAAAAFAASRSVIAADPALRGTFSATAGATIRQAALAEVLAQVRAGGAADLYTGTAAAALLRDAAGAFTAADLARVAPRWDEPRPAPGTTLVPVATTPDGATGFIVADSGGRVVACLLAMGKPFGAGRAGRNTGIVFGAPATGATAIMVQVGPADPSAVTVTAGAASMTCVPLGRVAPRRCAFVSSPPGG